jgi:hypothetical protein
MRLWHLAAVVAADRREGKAHHGVEKLTPAHTRRRAAQKSSTGREKQPVSACSGVTEHTCHRHARACRGHLRLSCLALAKQGVDGRDKPGHDSEEMVRRGRDPL